VAVGSVATLGGRRFYNLSAFAQFRKIEWCMNFRILKSKESNRFSIICFAVLMLISLLYFNSLRNNFVNWDDPGLILRNKRIQSLDPENIREMFTPRKFLTFQPLRMFSYALDYRIWEFNPIGYRITNILFYIFTCVTVFLTLRLLSAHLREDKGPPSHFRVGLFGSLLFVAHPVHVEAVTWLSARKEVLQGFFFFLAFYFYLEGKEREGQKRIIFLSLVLFSILLALLSKPSAVVFPAVLLIYEITLRQKRWIDFVKRHWLFFTLCFILSLLFTLIMMRVMLNAGGIKAYRGGTFFNNLLVSFYVLLYNIKLLVFTINYSAAYTIRVPFPLVNLQTLIVVGTVFLLFGLSLWSLKKTRVIFFCFLFFFVTLLPYLNLIPISTLLADRYLFIASFSYCFLLGVGFDKLYMFVNRRFSEGFFKLLSIAIFLFLLGGYSFMTLQQNKIWENSYTLWSDAVEKYPESNTANALMGVVYMDLGMNEKAVEYLEKAVQILPIDYESRNNLGIVYGRLDKPEEALKELLTAISLKPDNDIIKINLSVFYEKQKEYKKAEEILKYLISKNPKNAGLYYRLGVLYKEMGVYESAISELVKGLKLAPDLINIYEELGNIYVSRMKDVEKGKYYYHRGIEAAPKAQLKVDDLRWMIQDLECHR
jgi:tetratricopeptide (TPR) repeat protein